MNVRPIIFAAALCLVLAGIVALGSGDVGALPSNEVDTLWLDAAGNETGSFFRGCNGERLTEGTPSPYKIVNTTACSSGFVASTCYENLTQKSCGAYPFRYICFTVGGSWVCV
jgi:hypothetical protein